MSTKKRNNAQLQRLTRIIWLTRPDLQALFSDEHDEGFHQWLLLHGRHEYAGIAEVLPFVPLPILNEPDPSAQRQASPYLTRFMRTLWHTRPDLQETFDLSGGYGQTAFIRWYFLFGVHEHALHDYITNAQLKWLLSPAHSTPYVPNILMLVWQQDPYLQQQFDGPTSPGFLHWAKEQGQRQYPVLKALTTLAERPHIHGASTNTTDDAPQRPFGVNLIGYANGQFGIGEDVRMAALACEAASIPFTIYNVMPGQEVDLASSEADKHVSDDLPYAINIFCTTGIETARLAAVEGSKLFKGHYCIGYWPWELPEWPKAWHIAYEWVDEIWASSRFAYQAYAASSPKPVRHMPMAVHVGESAQRTRRDFGLPETDTLFVFSFDCLSSVQRKNPQACVEAFQLAFPEGSEPVGLVVKAMRAEADNPLWQQLQAQAARDPRIHIISETLSRGDVLDLYRVCDAFISLHRSEGFGRGIAEAMQLGKPVITTGYSGNLDFTTPATAALVDHQPKLLGDADYPFGQGQSWAEPNVEHAAWWMRRLIAQPDVANALAQQGQTLTQAAYSPESVGRYYSAVLNTLP